MFFAVGWNSFHLGFGRKVDPEPGRCRRTDGKKWRCSKEAYPDSKYCERHMHRGRNRSRKPVETPPNISSITKNTTNSSSSARQEKYFFLESNAYSSTPVKDYRFLKTPLGYVILSLFLIDKWLVLVYVVETAMGILGPQEMSMILGKWHNWHSVMWSKILITPLISTIERLWRIRSPTKLCIIFSMNGHQRTTKTLRTNF